jgi:hypothetical protein
MTVPLSTRFTSVDVAELKRLVALTTNTAVKAWMTEAITEAEPTAPQQTVSLSIVTHMPCVHWNVS